METLEPVENDTMDTKLLQQLSRTPYACSSLSAPLSTRDGNVVYRGILSQPIRAQGSGIMAKSIIIKHSTDNVPKVFEELLLSSLANFSPSTTTTTTTTTATIKAPRLYLYDQETNTQVLEDFPDTNVFRAVLFSANVSLPVTTARDIGYSLGFWLRSFHTWASAPEQAVLQEQIWRNDHMRKTKYLFTYGSILKVLENFPELLEGHERTLETFQDAMAKEFERPVTEDGDGYGPIHGDFWSGNILLPSTGWLEPSETNELFIIDWEFAQFGHRSTDLGQIVGDLYERKVYNNLDQALSVMEGVIDGYGVLSEEMAFRTAMYVGVHLISYYIRRPRRGPRVVAPEVIVAGLRVGRDFIVKGLERDRAFFRGSVLASLFAAE